MSYSTKDDILGEIPEEVLIQLTDDANMGVVNDGTLGRALARASAEVDGYCSNLYPVPFEPVPPFIQAQDLDLAIYHLFSRRENVPENRLKRYLNAVKVLTGIAKGDIQLGSKTAPEQTGQTIAVADAPQGIFSTERLRNY